MTMTKMKIFVAPDGSVKARVIGSARDIGMLQEYTQANVGNIDVINVKLPFGELFNQAPICAVNATAADSGSVGVSGMKFVLAPEMTPSLASLTVLGLERDSAESAARGSLGKRTPDAKLGAIPGIRVRFSALFQPRLPWHIRMRGDVRGRQRHRRTMRVDVLL